MATVYIQAGTLPYPNDAARSQSIRSSGATLGAEKAELCLHAQLPNLNPCLSSPPAPQFSLPGTSGFPAPTQ